MNSILKISWLEFKYILSGIGFWIGIFLSVLFSFLFYLTTPPGSKLLTFDFFYFRFADISYYLLIIVASLHLSKDFALRTSRIIFTGPLSRLHILVVKFLTLLWVGWFIGLLNRLAGIVFWLAANKESSYEQMLWSFVDTLYIYTAVTIFIVSIAFLLTAIKLSRMFTLVLCPMIFIFERQLRGLLMLFLQAKEIGVPIVLEKSPFNLVTVAFSYNVLRANDFVVLLSTSVVFLMVTVFIMQKRDLF